MTTDPAQLNSAYGRPLIQIAREIGKHLATMHRWRMSGVLDASGVRRRLPMTRVGGRWYVKDEDLTAFFASLTEISAPAVPPSTKTARPRSAERITRELDSIGI